MEVIGGFVPIVYIMILDVLQFVVYPKEVKWIAILQENPFALLKCIVALSGFELGVVALINSGHHLNFDLCKSFFLTKFS